MSHIVTVRATKFTDRQALREAVRRLKDAAIIGEQMFHLFSRRIKGLGIQLSGWQYPVVVGEDGTIAYDNFGGHWGDQAELDRLVQAYLVEKTKIEARLQGHVVEESVCENGDVVIRMSAAL